MRAPCLDVIAGYLHRRLKLSVPLDLAAVSRGLGVGVVRMVEIPELGRLTWQEDRPTITIRRSLSHQRRRFTWAHEIAHLILEDKIPAFRMPTQITTGDRAINVQLERDCDSLAASLLMPRQWIETKVSSEHASLRTFSDIASCADVSLTSAFIRARPFGPPSMALLSFRRGRYLNCMGLPFELGRPSDFEFVKCGSAHLATLTFGDRTVQFRADLKGDTDRGVALLLPLTPNNTAPRLRSATRR